MLLASWGVKGFSWEYEEVVHGEELNRGYLDLVDFCCIFTFKMGEKADVFEVC